MEGKIDDIWMADENHGVIVYNDLDTSGGQSGSMVLLTEEQSKVTAMISDDIKSDNVKTFPVGTRSVQIHGTNIAVHTGGNGIRNWATIITPTIM